MQIDLQQIKAENNRKSPLTRDESLRILAEIARGPRDEFIKASDQERAIEIASRMCGWNEEKDHVAPGNTLMIYLTELRQQKLEPGSFRVLENGDK